jgi:hypothetical protein
MKNITVYTLHISVARPYGRQSLADRLSCRFVTRRANLKLLNPLPENL